MKSFQNIRLWSSYFQKHSIKWKHSTSYRLR